MTRHLLDEVLDAKQQREEERSGRMPTITERVERGAALLDEKMPGWWQRVDLGRLDIESGCNCVIGQLGSYPETSEGFGLLSSLDDFTHGFDGGEPDDYRALTKAWRDLILARYVAASVTA